MDEDMASGGVVLSRGLAASVLLYEVLSDSVRAFPDAFSDLGFVDSSVQFREKYPALLPWFEATRVDSPDRLLIAESLVRGAASKVVWGTNGLEIPLVDKVAEGVEPFDLKTKVFGLDGSLIPNVVWDGQARNGGDLITSTADLIESGFASKEVLDGIRWIVQEAGTEGITLRNRRIVVMGASAELAPTQLFLEGGADVLWIDLRPPPEELLNSERLSGRLHWVDGGSDLLAQPNRIRSTIEEFAGKEAIDLGLYAYGPGHTREWRLTATMNAIVNCLSKETARTITLLISPTTCGVLSETDLELEAQNLDERPTWQALAQRSGLLGHGQGHVRVGDTCTNRGIVPIQGTSYAAAQYLGKLIPAEVWATSDSTYCVSANTAGVSRTASVRHPVFDTAFEGATAFGVRTFSPETTARLNGLLAIRDWLKPRHGPTGNNDPTMANAVTSTRVHGGIYNLPYPLDRALRVAAGLGAARHPQRIISMLHS